MELSQKNIGLAVSGSFCTFDKLKPELKKLVALNTNVIPIFSFNTQRIDSRFGPAKEFTDEIVSITKNQPVLTIEEAEPFGPGRSLDVLLILPCTGNTLAKLCNGITDTPVLMAAKAHMRNNRPVVIFLSTNDALGMNFKNIGMLLNMKHIFFIPFGQDNYLSKPNSMVSHMELTIPTLEAALEGKQLQPVIRSPF